MYTFWIKYITFNNIILFSTFFYQQQVATSTDYEDGETVVDLNQFNENQKARLIH